MRIDRHRPPPAKIAVIGNFAGGYPATMTGATNGVKEFDQGENLSQSSDVLALIDVYGLSDLAKIGRLRQRARGGTLLCVSFRGAMAKRHGDKLTHERRRTNPERAAKANPINYVLAAAPPF